MTLPPSPAQRATVLAIALLLVIAGCTPVVSTYPSLQEISSASGVLFCRIAVLPFQNSSSYHQADKIAGRVFQAELAKKANGLVVPEGDVIRLYQQLRLYTYQQPDSEHIRIIRERLDADTIISGQVTEMSEEPAADGVNPLIAVQILIHDARSGRMLAMVNHRRDGEHYRKIMHFGKVNTITQLTRIVFEEAISLCLQKGLFSCPQP